MTAAEAKNSSHLDAMVRNAMLSLYAGSPLPIDREAAAFSPFPSSVTDPYAAQETDPHLVMNMTYSAMVVWIDEAQKANYFTEHFVKLSRLIMNGVTTMGRGLVTLHNLGEDLSATPMSIKELIGVASYHFRKSYLGVMQTAASHPAVSERLLLNQLGWTNVILRLYKTKEKLEKPAVQRADAGRSAAYLPAGEAKAISDGEIRGLDDVSGLFEPGAFGAQRALSPLGRNPGQGAHGKKRACGDGQLSKAGSPALSQKPETETKEQAHLTADRPKEGPQAADETEIREQEEAPDSRRQPAGSAEDSGRTAGTENNYDKSQITEPMTPEETERFAAGFDRKHPDFTPKLLCGTRWPGFDLFEEDPFEAMDDP